jgi:hypothetical protein
MSDYDVTKQTLGTMHGYRADGSLMYYSDFYNGKGTYVGKNGEKKEFNFFDKDKKIIDEVYDEYRNLITEDIETK